MTDNRDHYKAALEKYSGHDLASTLDELQWTPHRSELPATTDIHHPLFVGAMLFAVRELYGVPTFVPKWQRSLAPGVSNVWCYHGPILVVTATEGELLAALILHAHKTMPKQTKLRLRFKRRRK